MKWNWLLIPCVAVLACLSTTPYLMGQVDGGSVVGVVHDSSGAVVPKADVTLTGTQTGTVFTTKTSSAGDYIFPSVLVGIYNLSVSAPGFQQSVSQNIVVALNKTSSVEVTLHVGAATSTVSVQANSSTLETQTSQNTTSIDQKTYDDLPIALTGGARSATVVADLMPGVSDNNGGSYGQAGAQGQVFATSISGGQGWGGAEAYDGIPMVTAQVAGDYRVQPVPVEALGEFSLVQNNFSAEYGRTPGGILTFSTRAGTNAFHGQAYEFIRNTALDAGNYFSTNGATPTHQNEFGVNVGGPIVIPHVFNGRDKLFFFGFYSGFRLVSQTNPSQDTLPTTAERTGDFTGLVNNGVQIPIYDPTTTTCTPAGVCTRQQYSYNGVLNVIDPAKISVAGQTYASHLPQPTSPALFNNYTSGGVSNTTENRWGGRVDFHLHQSDQIYGFFSFGPVQADNYNTLFLAPINDYSSNIGQSYLGIVRTGWDHTFSPSLLLHLAAGFNRDSSFGHGLYTEVNDFGISNGLAATPQMYFSPGITPYPSSGGTGGSSQVEYAYVEQGFLSWTKGKQQIKIGGEYQRFGANHRNNQSIVDTLSPNETGQPGNPATGDPFASLLAGAFDQGAQSDSPFGVNNRFQYAAAYFQDDYKMLPNLTINLGMRYEIPWTQHVLDNVSSTFNPDYPNPGAGGHPGALIFQGHGAYSCNCNRFSSTRYVLFQPRIGFALKMDEKTVLHAGYGLFISSNGASMEQGYTTQLADGYNANPTVRSPDNGVTPAFYASNGYPDFVPPPFIDPTFDNNGAINWQPQKSGLPGVVGTYTLSIQRELPHGFLLDVGYVGNSAQHIGSQLENPNQIPIETIAEYGDATLRAPITSPLGQASGVPLPFPNFVALMGQNATVAQALRTYPQYQAIRVVKENNGHSAYNSMQVKLQRHFANGFSLLASYTWAKLMTNGDDEVAQFNDEGHGPQNTFNHRENYVNGLLQSPNVLAVSYTYDLPFGTGRKYLNHGIAGAVLGGWGVAGVQRYQAGTSLFQVEANNTLPIANSYLLPNYVPGQPEKGTWAGKFNPRVDHYINPNGFAQPAPGTFGNAARNIPLRCFGYYNEDLSARKDFHIYETSALQFRADFFDAFNRALFGTLNGASISGPGINPGFGTIGSQANNPRTIQLALKLVF